MSDWWKEYYEKLMEKKSSLENCDVPMWLQITHDKKCITSFFRTDGYIIPTCCNCKKTISCNNALNMLPLAETDKSHGCFVFFCERKECGKNVLEKITKYCNDKKMFPVPQSYHNPTLKNISNKNSKQPLKILDTVPHIYYELNKHGRQWFFSSAQDLQTGLIHKLVLKYCNETSQILLALTSENLLPKKMYKIKLGDKDISKIGKIIVVCEEVDNTIKMFWKNFSEEFRNGFKKDVL